MLFPVKDNCRSLVVRRAVAYPASGVTQSVVSRHWTLIPQPPSAAERDNCKYITVTVSRSYEIVNHY